MIICQSHTQQLQTICKQQNNDTQRKNFLTFDEQKKQRHQTKRKSQQNLSILIEHIR